jgi:hypothetical protein
MKQLIAAVLLLTAGTAFGAPVTWTIDSDSLEFYFTDGTAYGSFDYDASTNQYSNIDITTTNGDDWIHAQYEFLSPGELYPSSATTLSLVSSDRSDLTGWNAFELNFATALTDAGGTISIVYAVEGYCEDSNCDSLDYNGEPWRESFSGTGSVSAVPVPAAAWLFGSGLGLLGWLRRRQSA